MMVRAVAAVFGQLVGVARALREARREQREAKGLRARSVERTRRARRSSLSASAGAAPPPPSASASAASARARSRHHLPPARAQGVRLGERPPSLFGLAGQRAGLGGRAQRARGALRLSSVGERGRRRSVDRRRRRRLPRAQRQIALDEGRRRQHQRQLALRRQPARAFEQTPGGREIAHLDEHVRAVDQRRRQLRRRAQPPELAHGALAGGQRLAVDALLGEQRAQIERDAGDGVHVAVAGRQLVRASITAERVRARGRRAGRATHPDTRAARRRPRAGRPAPPERFAPAPAGRGRRARARPPPG